MFVIFTMRSRKKSKKNIRLSRMIDMYVNANQISATCTSI